MQGKIDISDLEVPGVFIPCRLPAIFYRGSKDVGDFMGRIGPLRVELSEIIRTDDNRKQAAVRVDRTVERVIEELLDLETELFAIAVLTEPKERTNFAALCDELRPVMRDIPLLPSVESM